MKEDQLTDNSSSQKKGKQIIGSDQIDKEKLSVNESVVNEDNKVFLIEDESVANLTENLKEQVKHILNNSSSVGKLALKGEEYFRGSCWAYLDYLVTCWHCIKDYKERFKFGQDKWEVDFNGVKNTTNRTVKFQVKKIINEDSHKDLAVMKVRPELHNPSPLEISTSSLAEGQLIYVIGFPTKDPEKNPDSDALFNEFYNYKVFMPGQILRIESDKKFIHDCSTLPGVSGGPIFDLISGKVIGIHQWGEHKKENWGIPIAKLVDIDLS